MKRRTFLAAATTAVGCLSGCLGGFDTEPEAAEWSHGVGGDIHAVSDGRVFFIEEFGDDTDGDGSIVALDAESGEKLWTYGSSHGYSTYTDMTVDDAVYVGYGDDAVGSGAGELYALELDGTERWRHDTGSVYERPRLADGTLYVGSDDGVVRAFDATEGDVLWRYELDAEASSGPSNPQVVTVEDAVYVAAGRLLALDPESGDRRWEYGGDDTYIRGGVAEDGVAYVGSRADVVALEDGEKLWRRNFESSPRVSLDEGRVFVQSGTALLRFGAADGEKHLSVDVDHLNAWAVYGNRLYAVGERLYAFDADDGTEHWSVSVADGLLDRLQVADDGDGHTVYVEQKDEAIHRVSPDGKVTWTQTVPGNVRGFLVDEQVYVGTDEGIYAFGGE